VIIAPLLGEDHRDAAAPDVAERLLADRPQHAANQLGIDPRAPHEQAIESGTQLRDDAKRLRSREQAERAGHVKPRSPAQATRGMPPRLTEPV
jgi:hypothetical protein